MILELINMIGIWHFDNRISDTARRAVQSSRVLFGKENAN